MTIRKIRHIPVIKNMVLPDPLRVLDEKTEKPITKTKEQRTMKKTTTKAKSKNKTSTKKSVAVSKGKKLCTTCNTTKKITEFAVNNARQDKLHGRCRSCESEYQKMRNASTVPKSTTKKSTKKTTAKKATAKKVTKKKSAKKKKK